MLFKQRKREKWENAADGGCGDGSWWFFDQKERKKGEVNEEREK